MAQADILAYGQHTVSAWHVFSTEIVKCAVICGVEVVWQTHATSLDCGCKFAGLRICTRACLLLKEVVSLPACLPACRRRHLWSPARIRSGGCMFSAEAA
jgi:hypothetical protein